MKRARGLRCGNFLACCFLGVGVNLVVMHVHLLLRMPGKLVLTILCVENFWEAPLFAQQNSADKAQLQCDRGLRCGSFVACCFLGVGVNLVVMHVHLLLRMPGKLVLTILCVENFWEAPLLAQQNSADKAQFQCDQARSILCS